MRSSSRTLELWKNFHLTKVADSQSTGCSASKFELQAIFLEGALKAQKKFS